MAAGGVDRGRAVRDRPGADLVRPGGQERDQAEQPVRQVDDPTEPGFRDPELLHEHGRLVGLELAELHLDLGRQRLDEGVAGACTRRRSAPTSSGAAARSPSPTLSSTRTGFWVRKRKPRIAFSSSGSRARSRIGVPGLETGVDPPQDGILALGRLALGGVAVPGAGLEPLDPALGHRQVGQQELEVEPLEVARRVDAAVGVRVGRVLERADDVEQRIRIAQPARGGRRGSSSVPTWPSVEGGGAGRSA